MKPDFEINVEDGIVRVRTFGVMSPGFGTRVITASLQCAKEASCSRMFYDFRLASLGEGITSLDDRPRMVKDLGVTADWRIAMLCTQRDRLFAFLENSAVASGLRLQVFTDEQEALRWLRA